MALGGDIEATDYNTIRGKIIEVMGTGLGSYGYGQTTVSSVVSSGNEITALQWTSLRYDVINALIHQTGTTPAAVLVRTGDVIDDQASDPVVNYNTLTETPRENRFDLAPSQSVTSEIDTKTYTSSWSNVASLEFTATFANANEARYFFNSGGNLKVTATRTGGTSSQQNEAWTQLLTTAGTQAFRASTDPDVVEYYSLTTDYQPYYELSDSAAYSDNLYKLSAKCDVADNSTGTATEVTIKVELIDGYEDPGPPAPGDLVDGTITVFLEEQKASGVLQPSEVADGGPTGNFSITSPSYTVSNITAT